MSIESLARLILASADSQGKLEDLAYTYPAIWGYARMRAIELLDAWMPPALKQVGDTVSAR